MRGRLPVYVDDGDPRQCLADEPPLVRAVVDEHEAVHAQTEGLGERVETLVLGPPIGDDVDEVVRPQPHTWVFTQRSTHRFRIVLADRGQQDPLRPDLLHHPLESEERLAAVAVTHLDALGAVLADRAAPERVVEIEYEALLGTPAELPGQVPDL